MSFPPLFILAVANLYSCFLHRVMGAILEDDKE